MRAQDIASRVFQESTVDFSNAVVSGIIPSLVRSSFSAYRVGDLAMHVYNTMCDSLSAYRSLFPQLRLVNVRSGHSGFAIGTEETWETPSISHLVFTFGPAYEDFPSYERGEIRRTRYINNKVVLFTTISSKIPFVSIALDSVDCNKFGINNFQTRSLRYLFNSVGAILRSVMMRRAFVDYTLDNIENIHEHYSRGFVSDGLALNRIFERPYSEWVFQKAIWKLCPQLISSTLLNVFSVEYYLRYLGELSVQNNSAGNDLIYSRTEDRSVFSVLRSALLKFIQDIHSPVLVNNTPDPEPEVLLICGLLQNLVNEQKVGLPKDLNSAYFEMLRLFKTQSAITSILTPVDQTVEKMLSADQQYISVLIEHLYEELV